MQLKIILLALSFLISMPAAAQYARRIVTQPALPASCSAAAGDVVFLSTGNRGLYRCVRPNVWAKLDNLEILNVKDFGAVGDGTTDDTSAFRAAFDALKQVVYPNGEAGPSVLAYTGTLLVPEGNYKITDKIELINAYGLKVVGLGRKATRFKWSGASSAIPMFYIADAARCEFSDFSVEMDPTEKPVLWAAFQILNDAGFSNIASSANSFHRIYIHGHQKMTYGVYIGGGVDANNEFHLFDDCHFRGYSDAAVYLTGLQSQNNRFLHCMMLGLGEDHVTPTGAYGIFAAKTGNQSSGFIVDSWTGGYHSAADFYIKGVSASGYSIYNANSEGSNRFLKTDSNNSAAPVVISTSRIATDNLNADLYVIDFQFAGNLLIQNCHIGTDGSVVDRLPKINLQNNKAIGAQIAGNHFSFSHTASGHNGTDASPIVVSGTAAPYAHVVYEANIFTNQFVSAESSLYLLPSGTTTIKAYYGAGPYITANAAGTTLSAINAAHDGQKIVVLIADGNTTVDFTGTNLLGNAGADWSPLSGDSMECVYDGANWRCDVRVGIKPLSAKLQLYSTAASLQELLHLNNPHGSGAGSKISFYQGADERGYIKSVYGDGWEMRIGADDAPTDLVTLSKGKLGLGTTVPAAKFEIYSSAAALQELLRLNNPHGSGAGSKISFTSGANERGYISSLYGDGWEMRIGAGDAPTDLVTLSKGKLGLGTTQPSAKFDVNSDVFRLRTAKTPATAGAACNAGDICWDADYIYVCVATDTWKRSALTTW